MRQVGKREKPPVVSIFGHGLHEQQKLTKLTGHVKMKALKMAVLEASVKSD